MTDEAAREMTFEEEAKLYKEETAEFLKSETVDSEPPFVNSILRRGNRIIRKASDRIERLQSENTRLKAEKDNFEYELMAVMHSVDKWLDGDDLKDNPATRAATAREKALQAIEREQAERDKAVGDLENLIDCYCACNYCANLMPDGACEAERNGACTCLPKWKGLEESECEK